MRNRIYSLITLILAGCIIFLTSCSPPRVDVYADYILAGFEDNSTMELTQNTPDFKEISDEAIRCFQYVGLATECYFGSEEIEAIRRANKFVEIRFDEAVEVPTSVHVNDLEQEIRDKHGRKTTKEGYLISDLKSAVFPFKGDYEDHVLYQRGNQDSTWYCFKGGRSFSKLERLINTLVK